MHITTYITRIIDDIKRFYIERKYISTNRDINCWLFGEWFGKKCNDNSFFLANYIALNHPEICLYWVACEDTDTSRLDNKIHIIKYDGEESKIIFKRVGVVVMNQGYIDFSSKGYNYFRGAVTVNLWHGVAWKKIGHDKTKAKGLIHNLHENVFDYFEKAEKYVSLSRRYSEILHTAFHATDNEIIKAGYPRNMYYYSLDWLELNRNLLIKRLSEEKLMPVSSQVKIILYMPTFRDRTIDMCSLDCLADDLDFYNWMEENNVFIIQKAHFVS